LNRSLWTGLLATSVCAAACSSSSGASPATAGDAGSSSGLTDGSVSLVLDTPAAINAYLAGKTMVENGADLPHDPDGRNENTITAGEFHCWNKSTIQISPSGEWQNTVLLGTETKTGDSGDSGTCETASVFGAPIPFTAPAASIINVQGNATCFDIDVPYTFKGSVTPSPENSGRGSISADGKTVSLEVYFTAQRPPGDSCADGPVGSPGVTIGGVAFTGNAVQVYRIQ
jgi:hypothetical protein